MKLLRENLTNHQNQTKLNHYLMKHQKEEILKVLEDSLLVA
jgi:hypothetical protein